METFVQKQTKHLPPLKVNVFGLIYLFVCVCVYVCVRGGGGGLRTENSN